MLQLLPCLSALSSFLQFHFMADPFAAFAKKYAVLRRKSPVFCTTIESGAEDCFFGHTLHAACAARKALPGAVISAGFYPSSGFYLKKNTQFIKKQP